MCVSQIICRCDWLVATSNHQPLWFYSTMNVLCSTSSQERKDVGACSITSSQKCLYIYTYTVEKGNQDTPSLMKRRCCLLHSLQIYLIYVYMQAKGNGKSKILCAIKFAEHINCRYNYYIFHYDTAEFYIDNV